MTPDLERAGQASMMRAHDGRRANHKDCVAAALRALETLSPEVVSAMLTAYWGDEDWKHDVPPHIDEERAKMLAAWRAGLNAILAAEGKDG